MRGRNTAITANISHSGMSNSLSPTPNLHIRAYCPREKIVRILQSVDVQRNCVYLPKAFMLPCGSSVFGSSVINSSPRYSRAASLDHSSDALLAPGTKWSQEPTDNLPAAWASCTNDADIVAANVVAADALMDRRRQNDLIFTGHTPILFEERQAI